MREYDIVEINPNEKHVVIDTIDNNEKQYLLLAKYDEAKEDISNELEIRYIINENTANIMTIEDEAMYEIIKETFERKLKNKRESN